MDEGTLEPDRLIDQARARTECDDVGDEAFREPFELLLAGARARGDWTRRGLAQLASEIATHLDNRLRVVDYLKRHPEVLDAPVESPIVVMGMPRTGTTLVSYLLDCDPQWRSLLNWEAVDSVPPASTEMLRTDPRCIERKRIQQRIFDAIPEPISHWEWADGPTECIFLQSQEFRSLMWEARAPSDAYAEFMLAADMLPAYEYQKRVLQILQSKAPGRWALKMPSHSLHIHALLRTFPDARVIWMHRDPFAAIASLFQMIADSHAMLLEKPDIEHIRRTYPRQMAEHLRRPLHALAGAPEERLFGLDFSSLVRDPIGNMRQLYAWLGAELSPQVEARMRAWLAEDNARQAKRPGASLDRFGFTRDQLRPYFQEYLSHYPVEGTG